VIQKKFGGSRLSTLIFLGEGRNETATATPDEKGDAMKTRSIQALALVSMFLVPAAAATAQYYGYSSTAAEGFMHGAADMTRAAGEFNLRTSQAAINAQQAYSQAVHNQRARLETRWELKREYESRRAERRPRPTTSDEVARWNSERRPQRLSSSQLDPADGAIRWFGVLENDEYASGRAELAQLFAERRSEKSGAGTSNCREIKRAVEGLKRQLARDAKHISIDEYTPARKFLDSLAYEARFAPLTANEALAAK
jgi:hypothetical protein